MNEILVIEADGQPALTIVVEPPVELKFEDTGLQGPPGQEVDPGDLTLIFDNKLI